MPAALPILAAIAQAGGATWAAVALTATYIAVSTYQQRKEADAQQEAARNSLVDRITTVRNSAAARRIVYGRQRMGGDTILYHRKHGARGENLTVIVPVAPHLIDGFESYWLGDHEEPVSMLDGTSTSSGGGGWVLPGSKWYVADPQMLTMPLTGGLAGTTYALGQKITQVMSLAQRTLDGDTYTDRTLVQGVDYTVTGTLTSDLTLLVDLPAANLVFTGIYQYTGATLRIKFFLGLEEGERDLDLEADSDGEWTATDLLCGVARMHITLHYNPTVYGVIGFPNPSATFRGALVKDWATDEVTWSRNAARCLADYLTREDGHGFAAARVLDVAVEAAQAICDEWVPYQPFSVDTADNTVNIDGTPFAVGDDVRFYTTGTLPAPLSGATTYRIVEVLDTASTGGIYRISATAGGSPIDITTAGSGTLMAMQRRYTCDSVVSTDAEVSENARILMSAMAGSVAKIGGKLVLRAGAFSAPVYTLEESDIVGGDDDEDAEWVIRPEARTADLYNCVRGTFVDASTSGQWSVSSFDTYESATYIAEDDSQRRYLDVPLAATLDRHRAQRIAKLILHKSRLSLTGIGSFNVRASPVQPLDTVYMPFDMPGWADFNGGAGKIMRIEEVARNPNGRVDISFAEEAESVYAWDFNEAVVGDAAPNTAGPDLSIVEPVGPMTFTSSATTYDSVEGGKARPYAVIGWPAITQYTVLQGGHLRLRWRAAADAVWQEQSPIDPTATSTKIYGIAPGQTIVAEMVAVNAVRVVSPITPGVFAVSLDLPSSEAKASGNLLSFSTLVDTNGLVIWPDAGATDQFKVEKTVYTINTTPGSVLFYQLGNQQVNAYMDFPPVSAVPGQAYAAFASLCNARNDSAVQLVFLDAAGALAGFLESDRSTHVGDSTTEAGYVQAGVRMVAPPNAKTAFLRIHKFPTSLAQPEASSGTYVLKPFIGPITGTSQPFPVWNTGAAVSSRTQDIAPGATSELTVYEAAPVVGLHYNAATLCTASPTLGPWPIDVQVKVTAKTLLAYDGGQIGSIVPKKGPSIFVRIYRDGLLIEQSDPATAPDATVYVRQYEHLAQVREVILIPAGHTVAVEMMGLQAEVSDIFLGSWAARNAVLTVDVNKLR